MVHIGITRAQSLLIEDRWNGRMMKTREEISERKKVIELRGISNGHWWNGMETDPAHPLELLPEIDIWKKILGYLIDPIDITSAYRACSFFSKMLEQKRVLALFPQVLEILRDRKVLFKKGMLPSHDLKRYDDILNLRLISKPCMSSVDQVLFERKCMDKDWYLKLPSSVPIYYPKIVLKSIPMVNELISYFKSEGFAGPGTKNIFTRSLIITEKEFFKDHFDPQFVESLTQFQDRVCDLLELCSSSIWSLTYEAGREPYRNSYLALRRWAMLLPNLKALSVSTLFTRPDRMRGLPMFNSAVREQEDNEIRRFTTEFPFPSIPSLEYFYGDGMPELIHISILRANLNIKTCLTDKMELDNEVFSCLETLQIERFSTGQMSKSQLSLLHFVNWPALSVLQLNNYSGNPTPWPTSALFNLLKKFENLRELEILMNMEYDGGFLELPALSKLTIRLPQNYSSVDFLIPLKSLVDFKAFVEEDERLKEEDPNELINFKGFADKLNESNIWKYFPFLKRVHLDPGWLGSWSRIYVRSVSGIARADAFVVAYVLPRNAQ